MDCDRNTVFELVNGIDDQEIAQPIYRSVPLSASQDSAKKKLVNAHAKSGFYPLVKPKVPRECDPDREYEFIYELKPGDGRGYCLASSKYDHSIVIVRRITDRAVFELERNDPYALSLKDALTWNNSTFCVYIYPGIALSDVVWMPCTALRDLRLICKEIIRGLDSLNRVGCYFQELYEHDIFISERDGRIKLAFDRTVHIGPCQPPPQAKILMTMISRVLQSIDQSLVDDEVLSFVQTGKHAVELIELKEHPFIISASNMRFNQLAALAIRTAALSFQGIVRPEGLLKDMAEDSSGVCE